MRGVLLIGRSASQCPDTSGHLCTVDRVFQGVVPSRGVMAVELGFLSEHMTSLGYWSHLPACAPRPARP